MSEHEEHVFRAIFGRRSVRRFVEDKEVEKEKILKLLRAGMAAPSACNIQPWDFIVVTEKDIVDRIKASIPRYGDYNAPVIIVVCGYRDFIPWEKDDGIIDCSAATENMLIAATAIGLGSVWIGGFDREELRRILGIPENVVPNCMMYLGYPAEEKEPRTKYLEEAVYWQRYDPERAHGPRPGNILVFGKQ